MTGAGGAGPAVVVVGASLAGLRAVEELRHRGFDGPITVVGAEPHLPYDRPPLSKQLLAGEWGLDRVALTVPTPGGLDGLGVDWRLGTRAVGLDTARRRVALEGGEELPYDGLVIATGATPRRLPGTDGLAGVHTLRTLDDALAIRAELDAGAGRVVVIGAGFIGAEVAATCRARGHAVTLLEALPVPLERALGREMGTVVAELHRDHGVDLRLGVGVAGFEGDGRVERVRLADGSAVPADLVVVGIGVSPATDWLAGSGLALDDGVVCDATTLAAPGIVVAATSPGGRAAGSASWCASSTGTTRWPWAPTRPAVCWPSRRSRPATAARSSPTTRCPGSGPTSTTARCSWPGGRRARRRWRSSTARPTSGASSPSTAVAVRWPACCP